LNGNAGFGIVAQTSGTAQNVSLAVDVLSGYTHVAPPGNPSNPVIYLHAVRRTGGVQRHIISRVADCGNDYSGRSNRIAHHWVIEEGDVRTLPGGPGVLVAQNIFRSNWNEKPAELPQKQITAPDVSPKKCTAWERLVGDAGWGGIVAERAEKGDPINIVFPPGYSGDNLRALIGEALALLPPPMRWRVTFSTYFISSQEASGDKVQIKCFLAGTEAVPMPNTLLIDLRQRLPAVSDGKYVALARGMVETPQKVPQQQQPKAAIPVVPTEPYELQETSVPGLPVPPTGVKVPGISVPKKKPKLDYASSGSFVTDKNSSVVDKNWKVYLVGIVAIILILVVFFVLPALWAMLKFSQDSLKRTESAHAEVACKLEKGKKNSEAWRLIVEGDEGSPGLIKELEKTQNSEADLKRELDGDENSLGLRQEKKFWEAERATKDATIADLTRDIDQIKGDEDTQRMRQHNAELVAKNQEQEAIISGLTESNKQLHEQQTFSEHVKNLPKMWTELRQKESLANSVFLWEHRNKVNLKFVCFNDGIIVKHPDNKRVEIYSGQTFSFLVAEIRLDDNGLKFDWKNVNENFEDWYQNNKQILLSVLHITIGDNQTHGIAFSPDVTIEMYTDQQGNK